MRLTLHTDYALRLLMYLAVRPGERVRLRDIADAYEISHEHLSKIVRRLQLAGWIEAIRGQGGGIRLACDPAQISVGDVTRMLGEADALVECMTSDNRCRIAPACGLRAALGAALDAFMHVLDGYTLADLTGGECRGALRELLHLPDRR